MAYEVIARKAGKRIFAALLAAILTVLCFTNMSTGNVSAADNKVTATTIASSFDRNYVNYYNTMNKEVASNPSIDTPREAVEKYLSYGDQSLTYRISGNGWKFNVQLPDITCDIISGGSNGSANLAIRNKNGNVIASVRRSVNKVEIFSSSTNDHERVIDLNTYNSSLNSKHFTMKSGNYTMESADIAVIITTIGSFYGSKISSTPSKTGIKNNTDLASYIGDYIIKHGHEASEIREQVIGIAKRKNGMVREYDFYSLYSTDQNELFTDKFAKSNSTNTQWTIFTGLTIARCGNSVRGSEERGAIITGFWGMVDGRGQDITLKFVRDNKIQITQGNKVVKTITCSLPSDTMMLEFNTGEFVDSDTVALGIMVDRALYEYAFREGAI